MRLIHQTEYRGHTLLMFDDYVADIGVLPVPHWIVVAPDGINMPGPPQETEDGARACIDRIIDLPPPHSTVHA